LPTSRGEGSVLDEHFLDCVILFSVAGYHCLYGEGGKKEGEKRGGGVGSGEKYYLGWEGKKERVKTRVEFDYSLCRSHPLPYAPKSWFWGESI